MVVMFDGLVSSEYSMMIDGDAHGGLRQLAWRRIAYGDVSRRRDGEQYRDAWTWRVG